MRGHLRARVESILFNPWNLAILPVLTKPCHLTEKRRRSLPDLSKPITITALGHYHPEQIIPNSLFEELDIGSSADWVAERTGILERRSCLTMDQIRDLRYGRTDAATLRDDPQTPKLADLSQKAWDYLSTRSPGSAEGLDLVLCGTSVPDYEIPANACAIAGTLGLQSPAFDINSACSSFVVNLHCASSLLRSDGHKKIAVFLPERYTYRLDFADRATSVLFGDGCACAIVESGLKKGGLEVLGTIVASDPSKFDLVRINLGHKFYQNGQAVQKFAITRTIEATKAILDQCGYTIPEVSYFIGHQANFRMLTSAAEKMGFSPEKHIFNVDYFGNQGGAGAPCVLSMNWDRFKPGELIVVAVVGSGLTWGAALLRRTDDP